jgi:hypothetical protein
VLVFAPGLLHSRPNLIGGVIQALVAFGIGYLLDRALGIMLRRKAARAERESSSA